MSTISIESEILDCAAPSLFAIELPANALWAADESLRGESRWTLPGVTCDVCRRSWAGSTVLPTVDLSSLPNHHRFRPNNVPFSDYLAMVAELRSVVPADVPLSPGTQLGPYIGETSRDPGPAFLVGGWRLFVRYDVLIMLRSAGLSLRAGMADFKVSGRAAPYWEIEAIPTVTLNVRYLRLGCDRCGFRSASIPRDLAATPSSVARMRDDVVASSDIVGMIATRRFAEAVRDLELDSIGLRPLPVRDDDPDARCEIVAGKVALAGIKKEEGYLYYVRNGAIWRVRSGVGSVGPEKVRDVVFDEDPNSLYMLDEDGDVYRRPDLAPIPAHLLP